MPPAVIYQACTPCLTAGVRRPTHCAALLSHNQPGTFPIANRCLQECRGRLDGAAHVTAKDGELARTAVAHCSWRYMVPNEVCVPLAIVRLLPWLATTPAKSIPPAKSCSARAVAQVVLHGTKGVLTLNSVWGADEVAINGPVRGTLNLRPPPPHSSSRCTGQATPFHAQIRICWRDVQAMHPGEPERLNEVTKAPYAGPAQCAEGKWSGRGDAT